VLVSRVIPVTLIWLFSDARGLGDVRAAPHAAVKHHRPLHLATADAVKGAVARDGRGHGGEGIKRTGAAVQLRPPWLETTIPSAPLPHHAHNVHTPGTGLQKCSAQLRKVQVGLNKNVEHVALQESMVAMASSARSTPFTMAGGPLPFTRFRLKTDMGGLSQAGREQERPGPVQYNIPPVSCVFDGL
jgi:hypothetical protein